MKQMRSLFDHTLIITTIVCLLPMVLSVMVHQDLPNQAAMHFNAAGEPDNYASKAFAPLSLPS